MLGNVVFVGQEGPDAPELEDTLAPVQDGKLIHTGQVFATMSSDEFKNGQKNNPPRLREGLYTLTLIPSHFVNVQCVSDLFGILSANLHL